MKLYWEIFLAFFYPNALTFGGGPAVIGLLQKEVVENWKWMSIGEFTDAVALGNTLPGPIATKMAAIVGFRVGGVMGSLVAVLSTVVPTAVAAVGLLGLYDTFKNEMWMKGMIKGVRPVVVILIAQAAYKMIPTSFVSVATVSIAIAAVVALEVFKIHPIVVIIAALAIGAIFLSK